MRALGGLLQPCPPQERNPSTSCSLTGSGLRQAPQNRGRGAEDAAEDGPWLQGGTSWRARPRPHGPHGCPRTLGNLTGSSSAQCPSSVLLLAASSAPSPDHVKGGSDGVQPAGNPAVVPARLVPGSLHSPARCPVSSRRAPFVPSHPWRRNSCFLFLTDHILKITAKRNYLKNEIKRGTKQTPTVSLISTDME